jgi:hypothetical protein
LSQQLIPEGTRRIVRLTNPDHQDVEIFFDLVGETPPPPQVLDGFAAGVIFYAMQSGRPLRVHGPMTKDALCNLRTFQEAWTRWKPYRYRKLELIPSELVSLRPATRLTAQGHCFHNESECKPGRRQIEFRMRELIFIGQPDQIELALEGVESVIKRIAADGFCRKESMRALWPK